MVMFLHVSALPHPDLGSFRFLLRLRCSASTATVSLLQSDWRVGQKDLATFVNLSEDAGLPEWVRSNPFQAAVSEACEPAADTHNKASRAGAFNLREHLSKTIPCRHPRPSQATSQGPGLAIIRCLCHSRSLSKACLALLGVDDPAWSCVSAVEATKKEIRIYDRKRKVWEDVTLAS